MVLTTVRCRFCDNEFQITGRFDEHMDKTSTCPCCDTEMTTIFFDYITETKIESSAEGTN